MSYTRRAFRGASISLVFAILASLVAYGTRILLARNLSLQEYGLFYAVFNFVIFFLFFRDLGLGQALVKYIAEYRVNKKYQDIATSIKSVITFQVLSSLFFAAIFWIFADKLASSYFQIDSAALILRFLIVYVIFSILFIISKNIFQGFQRMVLYSSVELIKNLLVLGLVFLFFTQGFSLFSPVFAFALVSPILFLLYVPFVFNTFNLLHYKVKHFKTHTKKLFSFGVPVFATAVGGKIIGYLDTLFLTYFSSLSEVGIYNVVLPSALVFLFFSKAISSILFPLSSELWIKKENKRLSQGISLLHKYSFILMAPVISTVILFSPFLLELLFGKNYVAGTLSLQILLLGVPLYVVASMNNNLLSGIGKPKLVTLIILLSATLNILANIVLIPSYGIEGAAVATSLSYLFMLLFSTGLVSRNLKISFPWKNWGSLVIPLLILASVAFVTINIFQISPIFQFILVFIFSSIAFIVTLLILRVISLEELRRHLRRI